jgi:quercetin dioxygenase-like cupin family protein
MTRSTDRAAIESDWRARGFSCGLWTDPPGQEWRDFVHATDELVLLVEGEIELEFSGRTIRPAAGEEILIPARTAHTVRNVGDGTARWLYGYKES